MIKIHPNRIAWYLHTLIYAIIFSALIYLASEIIPFILTPALSVVWALAILFIIYHAIGARFVTLEIKDNELIYKKGIINIHSVTIPFNRITEFGYNQSILNRLLGVGILEIHTGSYHKTLIPNLTYKEVQSVLHILARARE
jgi:uncharacterized membrane protein YdbT with pleckstrin-like domain